MPLARCPRCNSFFDKKDKSICSKCVPDEDADYEKVRVYIQAHPDETADQVAEGSKVDRACVVRMMDQGIIQNSSLVKDIKCGRCGAPAISMTKRLCEKCLAQLNSKLAQETSRIKLPEKREATVHSHLPEIGKKKF
jgi:ribosomal protein L37E